MRYIIRFFFGGSESPLKSTIIEYNFWTIQVKMNEKDRGVTQNNTCTRLQVIKLIYQFFVPKKSKPSVTLSNYSKVGPILHFSSFFVWLNMALSRWLLFAAFVLSCVSMDFYFMPCPHNELWIECLKNDVGDSLISQPQEGKKIIIKEKRNRKRKQRKEKSSKISSSTFESRETEEKISSQRELLPVYSQVMVKVLWEYFQQKPRQGRKFFLFIFLFFIF